MTKESFAVLQFIKYTVQGIMETPYSIKVYYSNDNKKWAEKKWHIHVHVSIKLLNIKNLIDLMNRFKFEYEIDKGTGEIDYVFSYREKISLEEYL